MKLSELIARLSEMREAFDDDIDVWIQTSAGLTGVGDVRLEWSKVDGVRVPSVEIIDAGITDAEALRG